jgi:hypothetical protein
MTGIGSNTTKTSTMAGTWLDMSAAGGGGISYAIDKGPSRLFNRPSVDAIFLQSSKVVRRRSGFATGNAAMIGSPKDLSGQDVEVGSRKSKPAQGAESRDAFGWGYHLRTGGQASLDRQWYAICLLTQRSPWSISTSSPMRQILRRSRANGHWHYALLSPRSISSAAGVARAPGAS